MAAGRPPAHRAGHLLRGRRHHAGHRHDPGGGLDGLRESFGALIVAGAVAFVLAPFFTRLLRFFPPVVTGVVITVIGVSLLPVAVRWARGTPNTPESGSMRNVGLAGATLLVIVLIYRFLPGFFSRVAILLGLVLGTLVAIPFGATNFSRLGDAALFQLTTPFEFGTPTFAVGAIISMFLVMLVTMTETTADILAIGEVVGKPLTRRDVTGIKSRFVVAVSGVILVLLGLFPVLGAIVAVVPLPVIGGAGLVLFGTVAASGVRTLSRVEYEGNANLVIVAIALAFNSRRGHLEEAPIFAEAPPIGTTFEGDVEGIVTEGDPPHPTRPIHPHRPDGH